MEIPSDLPYKIASIVLKQGMECDALARKIRQSIGEYLENQLDMVKEEMGDKYDKEKEYKYDFSFFVEDEEESEMHRKIMEE